MQFLLTEEEFKSLNERAAKGDKAPSREALQELCSLAADKIPLEDGWAKGEPWGCILTRKDEWYCDDCPVQDMCPNPYKEWSK